MPHFITDKCTKCYFCFESCPFGAIVEKESKFVIDDQICVDCGYCFSICPEDAIVEK